MNLEKNAQYAWDFVFDKLYCEKTKLIYEYRTDESESGAFNHLPTKEEILSHYPNPCGWFTGMEDANINGGIMLEAIIHRYSVTKDESLRRYANDLYEGMMLNATLSKSEGFLIRSRLPEDGITHYINSSRDQYTHWIEVMVHFYFSELSSEEQKEAIKKVLLSFAKKAERDVTKENHYCLLDELGDPALVCSMAGELHVDIEWHETCRLPMFYIAAYAVSKDEHWLNMYHSVRDTALDSAETIDLSPNSYAIVFPLLQMQISLRLIYDFETELQYKDRYYALMHRVASSIDRFANAASDLAKSGFAMPKVVMPWRDVPNEYQIPKSSSIAGKKVMWPQTYLASGVDAERKVLRGGAESILTQLMCPDYQVSGEQVDAFLDVFRYISFESPFNYLAVTYSSAWWALKSANMI